MTPALEFGILGFFCAYVAKAQVYSATTVTDRTRKGVARSWALLILGCICASAALFLLVLSVHDEWEALT